MGNGLKTELKPCPCCGGEPRYNEYTVEDGYTGYRAGDIVCTQCGMRTISAPVDGTYGVEWTREDFAERWNKRTPVEDRDEVKRV